MPQAAIPFATHDCAGRSSGDRQPTTGPAANCRKNLQSFQDGTASVAATETAGFAAMPYLPVT